MIEGFCWPLSAAPGETIAFRDGEPLPVAVWQVLNSQLVTELADNVTFQAHRGLLQSRLLSSEDLQIRHHGVCSLVCHRLWGVGCSHRQDLALDHAGEGGKRECRSINVNLPHGPLRGSKMTGARRSRSEFPADLR